jgi:hypothetical protein
VTRLKGAIENPRGPGYWAFASKSGRRWRYGSRSQFIVQAWAVALDRLKLMVFSREVQNVLFLFTDKHIVSLDPSCDGLVMPNTPAECTHQCQNDTIMVWFCSEMCRTAPSHVILNRQPNSIFLVSSHKVS